MNPLGILCGIVVVLLCEIADNTAPRPLGPPEPREPRDWSRIGRSLAPVFGLVAVMAGLFVFIAWMDPGPPSDPPAIDHPYNPLDYDPYNPALNPKDYNLIG